MTPEPRDLHNLLPPDLVDAVEDADFVARSRIQNNRDIDEIDTLRDDVRARPCSSVFLSPLSFLPPGPESP